MAALSVRRYVALLGVCAVILAFMLLLSPGVGSSDIGVVRAWRSYFDPQSDPVAHTIAWTLRFPRAIKALIAGATLALCGAVFQTLFRNPLATPYTVGVAGGAALGALIAITIRWEVSYYGLSSVSFAAFIGAISVMLLILLLARSSAQVTGNTLLLAGVTIGFFCSGMMMFVTWLADINQVHRTVRWMMGDLGTFKSVEPKALLIIVLPSWAVLLWQARALDQFAVGSDIAASRGVNVARMEVIAILAGCLGVSAVVSMCGPIGFVGLVIPHVTRLIVGRDHRIVLPATLLLGAAFLIGCDFLTALVPGWYGAVTGLETTAAQLPIGVMTALIGTPVFLLLLCWKLR